MSKILRIGGVPEHFSPRWKQAIADRAFQPIGIELADAESWLVGVESLWHEL